MSTSGSSYKISESAKITIKRTILGHKWILKVNEKKHINDSKYARKSIIYICVLSIIFVSFCAGLVAVFYEPPHEFYLYRYNTESLLPITILKVPQTDLPTVPKVKDDYLSSNTIKSNEYKSPNNSNDAELYVNNCGQCARNEICIFLPNETIAKCKQVRDLTDPTGCGGICLLETQYCRKISAHFEVYQCKEPNKLKIHCNLDGQVPKFTCGELCISQNLICDGQIHCLDKSDEKQCDCNEQTHFQCGEHTSCLPLSYKCNGVVDCWDAKDEVNCTSPSCYQNDKFPCTNGQQCIQINQFCDGKIDCADKSDEPIGCL